MIALQTGSSSHQMRQCTSVLATISDARELGTAHYLNHLLKLLRGFGLPAHETMPSLRVNREESGRSRPRHGTKGATAFFDVEPACDVFGKWLARFHSFAERPA